MKLEIKDANEKIEFTIEERKRKSIRIEIRPPGIVHVVVPNNTRKKDIINFVFDKSSWIKKKLIKVRENELLKVERKFETGETLMFSGREYELKIVIDEKAKKPQVKLHNNKFHIVTAVNNLELLKKAMEIWYREQSLVLVLNRVSYYQKYINAIPNKVMVKQQKRRWGTCTSTGNIYFNWRCSMAPESVLDYLVVHEMCHLIHLNHSKNFWGLVEKVLPNYKESKKWLEKYGVKMSI